MRFCARSVAIFLNFPPLNSSHRCFAWTPEGDGEPPIHPLYYLTPENCVTQWGRSDLNAIYIQRTESVSPCSFTDSEGNISATKGRLEFVYLTRWSFHTDYSTTFQPLLPSDSGIYSLVDVDVFPLHLLFLFRDLLSPLWTSGPALEVPQTAFPLFLKLGPMCQRMSVLWLTCTL